MRALFCTSHPWDRTLGASKVLVELSDELADLGWRCDHVAIPDLLGARARLRPDAGEYAEALRSHLGERAHCYDVVDYDHQYLPFSRNEFSRDTLFVARSVLLRHHFERVTIPHRRSIRSLASPSERARYRRNTLPFRVRLAQRTVEEADLVNVSNVEAKDELVQRGLMPAKVIVLPYGLTRQERLGFEVCESAPPDTPRVAFVGTFDPRKGAHDFPRIFQEVVRRAPDTRFLLLGTAGLVKTRAAVVGAFPRGLRDRIEVVPRFAPNELPSLLSRCSIGVFPSYLEGFGFGVLEMLAACLPVVAYASPGAPMMLPARYLVAPGDARALGAKAAELLLDAQVLTEARLWARARAGDFAWSDIATQTSQIYTQELERLRAGREASSASRS